MKCPFCDEPLKEGMVFCEKCGNEIHLVPLFDPEVEDTIRTSMDNMVDEMNSDNHTSKETDTKQTKNYTNKKRLNKICWSLGIPVGILVVAILILVGISMLSKPKEFETYLQEAKDLYSVEKYAECITQLELAFEKDTIDQELLQDAYVLESRAYIMLSDSDSAIRTIKLGIEKVQQNEMLYDLWLQIHKEMQNYEEMANILKNVSYEEILAKYNDYICNPPQFDTKSGTYEEIVYLKFIDEGKGKIYYTINGEEPTKESDEYISPVKLENGSFTIKAFFINEYNVRSEMVEADYRIMIPTLDEPEITLESGEYYEPHYIDVFLYDDTYTVYYTVDGTDPDLSSNKYEGSIPLPIGKSYFKFIMYDSDGIASDIAERHYTFEFSNAAIDIEQSKILLLQNRIVNGVILDIEGHIPGTDEMKEYQFHSVIEDNGLHYYLFSEANTDSLQNSIRTGYYYAVDVNTGEVFEAKKSEQGIFTVSR